VYLVFATEPPEGPGCPNLQIRGRRRVARTMNSSAAPEAAAPTPSARSIRSTRNGSGPRPTASWATDLAQEVFVKAYEELTGFRGESSFSTWLYRIAANHAINKAGEIGRRTRLNEKFARERPDAAEPAGALDERVQRALGELSVKLRAVVVLRYLEGLSYEEIAETLDLSVGTVKSRLFLAHENLRPLLEDVRKDGTT